MKNVAKYATGLNLIYVVLICRDRFSAEVLNDLSNCKLNYDCV